MGAVTLHLAEVDDAPFAGAASPAILMAARCWALVFQPHGARYAFDLLGGDEPRLLLDHLREGAKGHQSVRQFAIQSAGELSQLSKRDVFVSFPLLCLVLLRPRDAVALGLLPLSEANGLAQELQPTSWWL